MSDKSYTPATLDEALDIRSHVETIPVAGGTDIMVRHRRHAPLPVELSAPPLFLSAIPELGEIRTGPEAATNALAKAEAPTRVLSVGACATLSTLATHPLCPAGLADAIADFASPAVRNAGTIGGNICNASPAGDTLPFLYAVNARVVIAGPDGERTLPVNEFITGPGSTALAANELLVQVLLPLGDPAFHFYRKVAPRRSNALSKLSVYAQTGVTGPGMEATPGDTPRPAITTFRLALGAVAPTVVRLPDAESLLEGAGPNDVRDRADAFIDLIAPLVRPIDDQRSTATYRRNTALKLVRHLLTQTLPAYLEKP